MILVTGATGQLGRIVVQQLVKKVSADQVVALVRDKNKASDLAALGVVVREADYDKPETLTFAKGDKVLLISSNAVGQRVSQHQAVIDAAKKAGVALLAYTSILRADTSKLGLAVEHKATEDALKASGVPYVLLRNGWYFENRTAQLGAAVEHGVILGASGDGRFAAATRADYAAAAVTVLTETGHENKIYELGGDKPYTLAELAAEVTRQSGRPVAFKNLPPADFKAALLGFGLPEGLSGLLADSDDHASRGELDTDSKDLQRLIGHPTGTLSEAVRAGLGAKAAV